MEHLTSMADTAKAGRCARYLASSKKRLYMSMSFALSTFTSIKVTANQKHEMKMSPQHRRRSIQSAVPDGQPTVIFQPSHRTLSDRDHAHPHASRTSRAAEAGNGYACGERSEIEGRIAQEGSNSDMCDGGKEKRRSAGHGEAAWRMVGRRTWGCGVGMVGRRGESSRVRRENARWSARGRGGGGMRGV
jgi:hypothetical protein